MSGEEKVRYKFFLGSGAREQEVSFASWSDLDLHKGVFTVRAKAEEGFTPKTHESRSIPLPANLVSILKERKKKPAHSRWVFVNDQGEPERHFLRKLKAVAKRAGLNCGHCTTETTDLNKQQRVEAFTEKFGTDPARFDEYGKQVTLKRTISCAQHPICQHYFLHRFRKTCATRWSDAGVPVRQIQAWLGHKDLTTTMRYLGVGDMHSPQTRSKIDAAFGD
jgi:integrase